MSAVKISAKSRYALHLMLELAMQNEGDNLSVKSVAESRGISEKYLEQVIPVLVRTGLVRSVRGAKGGYHLMKSPEDITVGLILRTVEGSIAPVSCLDDVVDHVTLADLVDKQRRLDARRACPGGQRGNC